MKLNINSKKVVSTLIAGGIALNASMLDVKAPTTEDTITMIITDGLKDKIIDTPNTDKLTPVYIKPIYDFKTVPTYDDIEIDGETKKVMTGIKEEKFISGWENQYIDPTFEEYLEEKYHSSKVKQR